MQLSASGRALSILQAALPNALPVITVDVSHPGSGLLCVLLDAFRPLFSLAGSL